MVFALDLPSPSQARCQPVLPPRHHTAIDSANVIPLRDVNLDSQNSMLAIVLETLLDAVMIMNHHGEILQANAKAVDICQQLTADHQECGQGANYLPAMIQPLFVALLETQCQFPKQSVLPEFQLYLSDGTSLRIRSQFLDIPRSVSEMPYVLMTIENRQESLLRVAIGDAHRFGLTEREAEVWHLRLLGHSYREIAQELYITENTVRKHVKSVLAKRRVELEEIA